MMTENDLCVQCNMCCNGTLFRRVELSPEDDISKLAVCNVVDGSFLQPCSALNDGKCTIYEDRPKSCRNFECALLVGFRSGQISFEEAVSVVRLELSRST